MASPSPEPEPRYPSRSGRRRAGGPRRSCPAPRRSRAARPIARGCGRHGDTRSGRRGRKRVGDQVVEHLVEPLTRAADVHPRLDLRPKGDASAPRRGRPRHRPARGSPPRLAPADRTGRRIGAGEREQPTDEAREPVDLLQRAREHVRRTRRARGSPAAAAAPSAACAAGGTHRRRTPAASEQRSSLATVSLKARASDRTSGGPSSVGARAERSPSPAASRPPPRREAAARSSAPASARATRATANDDRADPGQHQPVAVDARSTADVGYVIRTAPKTVPDRRDRHGDVEQVSSERAASTRTPCATRPRKARTISGREEKTGSRCAARSRRRRRAGRRPPRGRAPGAVAASRAAAGGARQFARGARALLRERGQRDGVALHLVCEVAALVAASNRRPAAPRATTRTKRRARRSSRSSRRFTGAEPEADAAHGLDPAGIAELPAQRRDVDVDRLRGAVPASSPRPPRGSAAG